MIQIGHDVSKTHHLALNSRCGLLGVFRDNCSISFGMLQDPVPDLKGQVQATPTILQDINDPYTLFRVRKGL
jgi:hypothetical protein